MSTKIIPKIITALPAADDMMQRHSEAQQYQRLVKKRRLAEQHAKEAREETLQSEERSGYFIENDNIQDIQEAEHFGAKVLDSHIEGEIHTQLKDLYQSARLNNSSDLGSYASKYLSEIELDAIWELFDDSTYSKDDLDSFVESLGEAPEGAEMSLIDTFIGKISNKAQIYMALYYILEEIRKKKVSKKKLQSQLVELVENYASQESGFLFEFFSIAKNDKLKQLLAPAKIGAIAKLNSGETEIANLRQTINFIEENFAGKFDNIVSLYIKLRAKQLIELRTLNFENRHKMAELFRIEQYLILANTLHLRVVDLSKKLLQSGMEIKAKACESILQLLSFTNSTVISDINVNNLMRGWELKNPTPGAKITMVNILLELFIKLPQEVFLNLQGRQKIGACMRALVLDYSKAIEKGIKPASSILKKHQPGKFYV